jgi:hypothetical protein
MVRHNVALQGRAQRVDRRAMPMQQKLSSAVNFTDDHVAHTSRGTSMPKPRMASLLDSRPCGGPRRGGQPSQVHLCRVAGIIVLADLKRCCETTVAAPVWPNPHLPCAAPWRLAVDRTVGRSRERAPRAPAVTSRAQWQIAAVSDTLAIQRRRGGCMDSRLCVARRNASGRSACQSVRWRRTDM